MTFQIRPQGAPTLDKRDPHRKRETGKDVAYMAWVASLPCIVSGRTEGVQAHHVKVGENRLGKRPYDRRTVPLHVALHLDTYPGALHAIGEKQFWNAHGLDPRTIVEELIHIYEQGRPQELIDLAYAYHHERAGVILERGIKIFPEAE